MTDIKKVGALTIIGQGPDAQNAGWLLRLKVSPCRET
jgi:hypothetical protein